MGILNFSLAALILMTQGYKLTFHLENGESFQVNSEELNHINVYETDDEKIDCPVLPEDATEVPPRFYRQKYVPLPLPSTLKTIGTSAFYACKNEVLVLPEGIEEIGNNACEKGRHTYTHFSGEQYRHDSEGTVKWIYLPKSIKAVGKNSLKGIWNSENGIIEGYENNPNIVIAAEFPPEGFFETTLVDLNWMIYEPQTVYVPAEFESNYLEKREAYIRNEFDNFKEPVEDRDEYWNWRYNFYLKYNPIYTYHPVSIEIIGGTASDGYKYSYQTTAENKGTFRSARWNTSDHTIATISDDGILKPQHVGKTHIQCIVTTKASDGSEIEFYFFKPVEITEDMITS